MRPKAASPGPAVSTPCPSSVPGPHPGDHVACKSQSLPRLPGLSAFSPLPCFWIHVEGSCPVFCRMLLPLGVLKVTLLIPLWLLVGLYCCVSCSPVAKGYATCSAWGVSPRWRLLLQSSALGHVPSVAAPRLQVQAQWLWCSGWGAPQRGIFLDQGSMESFKWSPCMGRQTLYHEATREGPPLGYD